MTTQATTDTGVAALSSSVFETEDDAANAFLSSWSDDGEGLSETEVETPETEGEGQESNEAVETAEEDDGSETDHQEGSDEEDETAKESEEDAGDDTDAAKKPAKALGDDAVVKVTVDGKELDVSVKDLKRLYGQEAALTRKSQEVAAKRTEADATSARLQASYQKLYDKALERFKPYAEIDMLVASKQLDADQFAALRKEAQAAYEEFRFVSEEADAFVKAQSAEQQKNHQAAAQEAIKVLKADIPEWSPKLYDSIREYSIAAGLDATRVNSIVDPVLIKLLHKARLYDESKKIATKKKVATPKKVIKATNSVSTKDTKGPSAAAAKAKLARSGSVDDATSLFLSRWASDEE